MRNLKRALSLALASVMLMGMMVVGSSAASFPDVDDNDNIEAIDVLETVQVMIGNENGDFEPDKNVTRAEMAVVMAKLLNLDYKYYETTCPFNDVPDWAKGWVGACAANGIVSGRGDGVYDPNATVTAVEAASMMMRALGYFQNPGDYSPNFEAATVRQASAISLFSGIGGNANTPLTRNQVAQLALNTLEANMVYFTGDMGFEMPGVGNVGYRSEYTARTGSEAKYRAISSLGTTVGGDNSQSYVQLGEQLYDGDLKKNTGVTNGFQAPATRWTYKTTEIGTYTNAENYMLEGEVKSSAMYSTVGRAVAEDYAWSVYMDGEAKDVFTKDDVKANNGDALKGTGRGTVTYVYLNSTSRTAIVTVVNTYAAEVSKVKDGKITLNDTAKQLEVEAAGYDEGDIVLYTKYKTGSSWKVGQVIGAAELVEGEAGTVRDGKFVVIGDTTYNYSTKFNESGESKVGVDSTGKDVALYLDTQGNIIYVGEANESTDYALVLDVGVASNKYGEKSEFGATLLLTDGTTLNVDLDKDYTDKVLEKAEEAGKAKATADVGAGGADDGKKEEPVVTLRKALQNKAVSYTKESNGTYTLSENKEGTTTVTTGVADAVKSGRSSIKLAEGKYAYTNENTVFVIHERDEKNTDVNVYTGYNNVPDVKTLAKDEKNDKPASVISVYTDSKNVVKAVFIMYAEIIGSKDIIFVVGDAGAKLEGKGDNRYWTYKAIVDGEATTIDVKNSSGADALDKVKVLKDKEVKVFTGMTVDSNGLVTKLKDVDKGGSVELKDYTGVQALSGKVYGFGWNAEEKVYDVKIAPNDKTVIAYLDGGDLTTQDNLDTDNNDKAIVVLDDGQLSAIFVTRVAGDEKIEEELPETVISEDNNGALNITTKDKLSNSQIRQAIAEYLKVDPEEVTYDAKEKTATCKGIKYQVVYNQVANEEEVAGAELAVKVENAVKEPYAEVKVEGNKLIVTGDDKYGSKTQDDKEGNVTRATADLARFLEALHNEGVKEIVYGEKTYVWDESAGVIDGTKPSGLRSKWVEKKAEEGEKQASEEEAELKTLVSAIAKAVTEGWKSGKVTFTIKADGKPIVFEINVPVSEDKAGS